MQLNSRLNDQQIMRLHRELLAPVAVHEIISGRDELDDTARYTLDVMIGEFKPDTALLCIALCAAHIAEKHAAYLPIAGGLGFEAGRIAHEWGPTWLAHADAHLTEAHEDHVMDLLDQMPEDFEALADLLDATRGHLLDNTDSAILCDILSLNARAFIDALEEQQRMEQRAQKALPKNLHVEGNVIAFPRPFKQH